MNAAAMTGLQALRRGLWLGLVGVVIFAATVPLLGEQLDTLTVSFALAVIATVFSSKKMTIRPAPGPSGAHNASHTG